MKRKIIIAVAAVVLVALITFIVIICIPVHYSDTVTVMNEDGETLELVIDLTRERDLILREVWSGTITVNGYSDSVFDQQSQRRWFGMPFLYFISWQEDGWETYNLCMKEIDGEIVYGLYISWSDRYGHTLGDYLSGVESPEEYDEVRWKIFPKTGFALPESFE